MKRVLFMAILGAIFVIGSHLRASAETEFCPAYLMIEPVDPIGPSGARIYGFVLNADSARTVSAVVAFDTTAGWYTASVPTVTLKPNEREYGRWFTGSSSDVMYVAFPSETKVRLAWVLSASSRGDTFGWSSKGQVSCDPGGAVIFKWPIRNRNERISAPPPQGTMMFVPIPSQALESTACVQPFLEATVVKAEVSEDFRDVTARIQATIEIAINADGSLRDAWVMVPSGYPEFDMASLAQVKRFKYRAARVYCRDFPGLFEIKATYVPDKT